MKNMNRNVAALFGELNGWELSDYFFPPEAIGQPHRRWDQQTAFRWPFGPNHHYHTAEAAQRSIAVVLEPPRRPIIATGSSSCSNFRVSHGLRPELDACAAQHGLQWHVPPIPRASIDPKKSLFIVMTLPGIKVVWLPEQKG
jgi:hypothetical protein